ncbi:histidine phosphatase family protein [Alteromonas sediminis]|uniref:Histidine phosphatase family protein n=1 Tax=Alteromonas sediminis TaxID=2259342 RepID=A0A3N5Y4U7_9ALTE|nr:histidine phosphatase family protein [Alteromonas sediminis]RPJ68650.1 histidine phosphatase family protein [Alteromonas sediminis]
MATLTLVRHGQASFGSADYDQLSPLGQQQCVWLGEYFKDSGKHFDHVVRGTLKRHQQSADCIMGSFPEVKAVDTDPRLNEFAFVEVVKAYLKKHPSLTPQADTPPREYYRILKKAMYAWQQDELDGALLSESWLDFKTRTHAALHDLLNSEYKNILVVSSGGAISLVLQSVLHAPDKTAIALNLQMKNASVSECFFGKGQASLSLFNSTSYMETAARREAITYS